MLKAPVAGAVKTRLARALGSGRAAAIARELARRTLAAADGGPWRMILAVDPASAVAGLGSPRAIRLWQGRGNLGARLRRAAAAAPSGPVVIIGADAPALRTRHIRAAFAALAGADAVFGPAADGGYWLVGLARRRAAPRLFHDVRWSTAFALEDTLRSLPPDFRIRMLEMLQDVDEPDDVPAIGLSSVA